MLRQSLVAPHHCRGLLGRHGCCSDGLLEGEAADEPKAGAERQSSGGDGLAFLVGPHKQGESRGQCS